MHEYCAYPCHLNSITLWWTIYIANVLFLLSGNLKANFNSTWQPGLEYLETLQSFQQIKRSSSFLTAVRRHWKLCNVCQCINEINCFSFRRPFQITFAFYWFVFPSLQVCFWRPTSQKLPPVRYFQVLFSFWERSSHEIATIYSFDSDSEMASSWKISYTRFSTPQSLTIDMAPENLTQLLRNQSGFLKGFHQPHRENQNGGVSRCQWK